MSPANFGKEVGSIMKQSEVYLGFIWEIGTVSALLAALITINVSLPLKLLAAGFLSLLFILLAAIRGIAEYINHLLYYIRCDYICNEMQRLDPANQTPARDIFKSDLELGKNFQKFEYILGHGEAFSALSWIICLIAIAICTIVFCVALSTWK
jgi:hypothetical protein